MLTKIFKSILIFTSAGLICSCDFEEKNIDPNSNTSIEPGPLLTYSQLNTTTGGQTKNIQVGTCMMLVQQAASLLSTEAAGDKYYQMSSSSNSLFNDTYSSCIKNWRELVIRASEDPKYENLLGAAKIWGAYLFQRMTDLYGDVPYSEAGWGYYKQIYNPQYDRQEDIYMDLIKEVKAGIALLSNDKPAISGDIFYDGNIDKWKKLGNSLLLRLGMRLSKVKPEMAKQIAAEAIQGGIMTAAEDGCMVKHMAGSRDALKNPLSLRYEKDKIIEEDKVKIGKTFMDYLKNTNDPRIKAYCSLKDGNNNPSVQVGLPNGYDNSTIGSVPNFPGIESISTFNTKTILKMDAPTIFLLASESKLLHAEAALRNWVSGNPDDLFKQAVRLSMEEQKVAYAITINGADIDNYINQNLFTNATTVEAKLQILNEQYWVVTFMNGYESYANWRRTGYPKLSPVNYPGNESEGKIPRRLSYATDEYTTNKANVDIAIGRQGADKVTTRIWWDKAE